MWLEIAALFCFLSNALACSCDSNMYHCRDINFEKVTKIHSLSAFQSGSLLPPNLWHLLLLRAAQFLLP